MINVSKFKKKPLERQLSQFTQSQQHKNTRKTVCLNVPCRRKLQFLVIGYPSDKPIPTIFSNHHMPTARPSWHSHRLLAAPFATTQHRRTVLTKCDFHTASTHHLPTFACDRDRTHMFSRKQIARARCSS